MKFDACCRCLFSGGGGGGGATFPEQRGRVLMWNRWRSVEFALAAINRNSKSKKLKIQKLTCLTPVNVNIWLGDNFHENFLHLSRELNSYIFNAHYFNYLKDLSSLNMEGFSFIPIYELFSGKRNHELLRNVIKPLCVSIETVEWSFCVALTTVKQTNSNKTVLKSWIWTCSEHRSCEVISPSLPPSSSSLLFIAPLGSGDLWGCFLPAVPLRTLCRPADLPVCLSGSVGVEGKKSE